MSNYRYQIAVAGHVTYPKKYLTEVQQQWLEEIGTCPEWGLYDTKENKYVKDTWENLGLDPAISQEICKLRMSINSLWGDALRTRKYYIND